MDFIKFHVVASSVNDTNIISYINTRHISQWVTAATTVIIQCSGLATDGVMDDTITITTAGIADTKLVADGLHSLMSSGWNSKAARTIGAGFNGAAITTITVAVAV